MVRVSKLAVLQNASVTSEVKNSHIVNVKHEMSNSLAYLHSGYIFLHDVNIVNMFSLVYLMFLRA
jgi:hypothetical protein